MSGMEFARYPHGVLSHVGQKVEDYATQHHTKQESRALTRFDLDYDVLDHFLPEFLVPMDNYYDLFNGILDPICASCKCMGSRGL
jgi:hypothetical protein